VFTFMCDFFNKLYFERQDVELKKQKNETAMREK